MRLSALAAVLVVALVGAACGDDSPDTVTPADTASTTIPDAAGGDDTDDVDDSAACSAAELEGTPTDDPDLPVAVETVRQDIIEAAVRCDYDDLAEIATTGEFNYSFGAEGDPAGYWRELEERGEETPLATLVRLLDGPFATIDNQGQTIYVWPTDAVEQDDYLSHRAGIDEDGDWLYFVAGD